MSQRRPHPFGYYVLAQLPGWLVLVLAALAVRELWRVPWVWLAGALLVMMAKDLALYPHMRRWYVPGELPAAPHPGEHGRARTPLQPDGMVTVRGELWQARSVTGDLARGSTVRVRGRSGLRLEVEAIAAEDALPGAPGHRNSELPGGGAG